jgi:hypothetical protein
VLDDVVAGPFPPRDGWAWLYRAFERIAPAGSRRRRWWCRYFYPNRLERWRRGQWFRFLGVHLFGAVIPTGGVFIRRLTGARMAPYTLAGTSVGGARAFYYRTCVFEALHLPFVVALVVLAVHRAMLGRWDLAFENSVVNLALNVYPILHHRRTRVRIVRILEQHRKMSSD